MIVMIVYVALKAPLCDLILLKVFSCVMDLLFVFRRHRLI
jgi:hypothetical protein